MHTSDIERIITLLDISSELLSHLPPDPSTHWSERIRIIQQEILFHNHFNH